MTGFDPTQFKTIPHGHSFEDACKRLEDVGADVVGLNCSRGPATLMPLLQGVRAAVSCPVAAQPVPYRTSADHPTSPPEPCFPDSTDRNASMATRVVSPPR